MAEYTFGRRKSGELVRAMKEHVLGVDCIRSHAHTTVLASSGVDGIKIWTPKTIDKGSIALSIAFGVHTLMPSAPVLARTVVCG
ncbi:hypothetical protein V6N13_122062 [Hibiscus sabdariffa]